MTLTDNQKTEYKEKAAEWARGRLADPNTVVLDLESTGLLREDPETEIAQICITDLQGRSLFNMLLKPSQPMADRVIDIQKITKCNLSHAPIPYSGWLRRQPRAITGRETRFLCP